MLDETTNSQEHSKDFISVAKSTVDALEGLGGSVYDDAGVTVKSELQEVINSSESGIQPPATQTAQAVEGEAAAQNQPPPVQVAEQQNSQGETVDDKGITVSSPIIGEINYGVKEEENKELSEGFDNWDNFEEFITNNDFGLTKENIKQELPKLVDTKNIFESTKSELDGYRSLLEVLPEDIVKQIEVFSTNGDWRSVMKNSEEAPDYTKSVKELDSKNLVLKYFPNTLSEDDWVEFNNGAAGDEVTQNKVKSYIQLSEKSFELEKTQFENKMLETENSSKQLMSIHQTAFDESRNNISKVFEGTSMNVENSYISEIDKIAQNKQGVLDLFYNKDGSLKSDAHQRLLMAHGGKDLVNNQAKALEKSLEKRSITKARTEVIASAPSEGNLNNSTSQQGQTAVQAAEESSQKEVERVFGTHTKSVYE